MRLVIDATNISTGGSVTHLVQFLTYYKTESSTFDTIEMVCSDELKTILKPKAEYVIFHNHKWLNSGIVKRGLWYFFLMDKYLRSKPTVLFNPGGGYTGSFRPYVTMCRNMLVFNPDERKKFGYSWLRIKFWLLYFKQTASFSRANGMIYISKYAKEEVEKVLKNKKESREVVIINHGVNESFNQSPKVQKLYEHYSIENPFKFIYVSTINYYKQQDKLVEAFNQLRKNGFPVQLTLVGGYLNQKIKDKLLKNIPANEQSTIKYMGKISHKELPALYQSSDAVIYASTCENMPNILIESMRSGLPILCSHYPPMPEFLGPNGCYFDPLNIDDICTAIKRFVKDKKLRQNKADLSYQESLNYSWSKCTQQTVKFLNTFNSEL